MEDIMPSKRKISDQGLLQYILLESFDYIKDNYKYIIAMLIISMISFYFWRYFQSEPQNDVYMEIFKAIFLASIIGLFLKGTSAQTFLIEKTNKLVEMQKQCLTRQSCCGALLPGIENAEIVNIFFPRTENYDPTKRMSELISKTKEILWVKQVSLRHLTRQNGILMNEFSGCYKNIKSIRMMPIKLDSDQAKIRSYREYLLKPIPTSNMLTYDNFVKEKYEEETLYRDTMDTINTLRNLKSVYYEDREANGDEFIIKTFFSSPDAAIFITDESVLYEPLHLGDINEIIRNFDNSNGPILSGKMPVFEFLKRDEPGMYHLIKNNFETVFDNFADDVGS